MDADRPTLPAAAIERMASAMAARWRELAAAKVEDSPEGHCADLARVAAAALPGWGTYRTAWESGHGVGRREAIEEVSKGLPASSAEIAAWLDAVNRLGETYDRALRDEIADLRQHGGMISAHWVAQALEHIADHGHRPPGPGEPPHIHHVPEPESEQP